MKKYCTQVFSIICGAFGPFGVTFLLIGYAVIDMVEHWQGKGETRKFMELHKQREREAFSRVKNRV